MYTKQCGTFLMNPFNHFAHNAVYHLNSKHAYTKFLKFLKRYNQPDLFDSTYAIKSITPATRQVRFMLPQTHTSTTQSSSNVVYLMNTNSTSPGTGNNPNNSNQNTNTLSQVKRM